MVAIANSLQYNTPEPILIVVGGLEWELVAHIFPRHGPPIRLTALELSRK